MNVKTGEMKELDAVRRRLEAKKDFITCQECDGKVPFIDFIEQRLKRDPVARKIAAFYSARKVSGLLRFWRWRRAEGSREISRWWSEERAEPPECAIEWIALRQEREKHAECPRLTFPCITIWFSAQRTVSRRCLRNCAAGFTNTSAARFAE